MYMYLKITVATLVNGMKGERCGSRDSRGVAWGGMAATCNEGGKNEDTGHCWNICSTGLAGGAASRGREEAWATPGH